MTERQHALIAWLLDDVRPSAQTKRWLATATGQRELAAYRRTVRALHHGYGDAARTVTRPPVYYVGIRSSVGRVFVAVSVVGLIRVSFRLDEESFVAQLRRLNVEAIKSTRKTAEAVAQLEAYFGGERRRFDLPVDLSTVTPFQHRVLTATGEVPAGEVVSYGEIAKRIGRPKASRAVGQALGHNPVPIVIPCHRVVAGGGGLGGYTGGVDLKKKLLRIEGVLS